VIFLVVLSLLASLPALAWLALVLHPARPWALRPRESCDHPDPPGWPSVDVIVPARNEERLLPRTLRALRAQDYPGEWRLAVVDDRSDDRTAEVAHAAGAAVVRGAPLPDGWAGKVWALEQGARMSGADFLLLTDADIRHSPRSLRCLVAEAEAGRLDLVSRMARLRCESGAERLLIPPFLFFFNLLYPMPLANAGRRPAAAGGCILLRRSTLDRIGGFRAMHGAVIDDLALARLVRGNLRLALAEADAVSLREHVGLGSVWRMVARTAFAELRYSRARLAATLVAILVLFPLPVLLLGAAVGLALTGATGWAIAGGVPTIAALALQAAVYLPTIRYFDLPRWRAGTLPLAGTVYGAMTLDSALASRTGRYS
jgi:hopene-associated glycosyltransferase HpnB